MPGSTHAKLGATLEFSSVDGVAIPGCQVSDVAAGSPAEKFGIQEGDTVLVIDGVPINTDADADKANTKPGPLLTVDWKRASDGTVHVGTGNFVSTALAGDDFVVVSVT